MKSKALKLIFTFFLLISMSVLFSNEADIFIAQAQLDSQKTTSSQDGISEVDTSLDMDHLFENSEDTTVVQTKPKEEKTTKEPDVSSQKKGINLSGNLSTLVGGYFWLNPVHFQPGAVFENLLSFSSRPIDSFSIKGSLLVSFPKMEIGLYELYFNYALWDIAYLMVGKKELSWGNARIFDTNILDDKNNHVYDPIELLNYKTKELEKSKFTVSLNIPVWYFNITALAFYENYREPNDPNRWDVSTITSDDVSYAGMIEANIANFSFDVFGRVWAINDTFRYNPALGINLNYQLGDLHLYMQYVTHGKRAEKEIIFPRMKGTVSAWWFTREKINLGFIAEYQIIADWYDYVPESGSIKVTPVDYSKFIRQYVALEAVWGRVFDSNFSLAVKYYHDFYEEYGTVIPGVKVHDLLPNTDLDFGIPIYYGSKNQCGIAIQAKLNVDF